MMDHNTIRQAAILIASLDKTQADELLQQLDPAEAEHMRQAVDNLSEEDLKSSRSVIEEFLSDYTPQVDAASSPAPTRQLEGNPTAEIPDRTYSKFNDRQPCDFQFLYKVSPPLVARFLGKIHKQIAAAVLARMPADLSGVFLSYLSPGQQSEILERITHSHDCEFTQIQTVTRLLRDCLMHISESETQYPSQHTAETIQQAVQDNFLHRTLTDIESNGTELSHLEYLHSRKRQVGPIDACSRSLLQETLATRKEILRFEDITLLNDNSLAKLFHHIDQKTLLLALAGAPTEVIQRITAPLKGQQAERFTEKLEQLTGVSLRQIEKAQKFIAAQATSMIQENTIQFIEQKPFHAAA